MSNRTINPQPTPSLVPPSNPSSNPSSSQPVVPTDEYFEADFELVQACKKFLKDCDDVRATSSINPFSGKRIKKYKPTFYNVKEKVKDYLNKLDDEEFHSPIRGVEFYVDKVPARDFQTNDYHLTKKVQNDVLVQDWHKKVEKRLKEMESVVKEDDSENRISTWKYNTSLLDIFKDDADFEMKKLRWIEQNPELYSWLDVFKPEVFQHKYLMKHLILHKYNFNHFIGNLHYSCDLFITKRYDAFTNNIPTEQRYAPSMIMLWIYHPLILNGRKFLKKNKMKINDYLKSKPSNLVRIKSQHISSLILANFISKAKVEDLSKIKENYDEYFNRIMTESFIYIDRETIFSRTHFYSMFPDFLANRIRPYRYTYIKFSDLEDFDKIIDMLDNKPKPIPQPPTMPNEIVISSDDEEEIIHMNTEDKSKTKVCAPPRVLLSKRIDPKCELSDISDSSDEER